MEPAVSEGKPKSDRNYTCIDLEGVRLYVSKSLEEKHLKVDLAGFLAWKWLTIKEI